MSTRLLASETVEGDEGRDEWKLLARSSCSDSWDRDEPRAGAPAGSGMALLLRWGR
ncbi:hypothetical protein BGZ68_003015, partial [Mortierella alpina]